jgi:(p)ppGpp synthase/HD superfamily hydrolase
MTTLTERFTKAVDYARVLFAGDVRKGTDIPYLSHLLAVSTIVLEHGGDEDEAIAALLHDAGEDKGGRARVEAISLEFGRRVARIVEACSDSLEPQGAPKAPWEERKAAYIDRISTENSDAALVSAADKLHNAAALRADYAVHGDELWGRFNATREQTLRYYARLAEVLPARLDPRAERLGALLRATVDALCADVRRG